MSEKDSNSNSKAKGTWLPDFLASTVVFLVALPLCIGIAVACGVPAERGLVTGIIGGIIVGVFSGAPLLVSGPAASLIVPVVDLIQNHGLVALAPVVAMAGVWQALAGIFKLGRWFRAVAPAVIIGMLIGIGVLILTAELHVCVDVEPKGGFIDNVVALPESLTPSLTGEASLAPLIISTVTIALIVLWGKYRPKRLALVPGQLIALLVVTIAASVLDSDLLFLDISPNFFDGLEPAKLADYELLLSAEMIGLSLMFAFIASAATLLTANAIDQRQTRSKAQYDREMFAQGVGNFLTGAVGGLPMTGVIVRSSVNVDAGAMTRKSTIMHGIWLLLFVSAAPELLELIPQASLGAILVYTGYRLIDRQALKELYQQGQVELAICLITLFGVVFIDLFIGIISGLAAAILKIVWTFARLQVRSEPSKSGKTQDLHLTGSATFLQLPRLAAALDEVPSDRELHVHIDQLDHIDHACLQLLSSWSRRRESEGLPGMIVEWDELTERYRKALVGKASGPEATPPPRYSMMGMVWEEWKRIYAPRDINADPPDSPWEDFVDASRARIGVDAKSLDDVVVAAAEALAPAAGRPADELAEALRTRIEGHVALGSGISVPHAPIDGLERSVAALVTTKEPVEVAGETADLFFVLLAPANDPRLHLQALAHVGRLCHDEVLLRGLRDAKSSEDAAAKLRAAGEGFDTDTGLRLDNRLMAVVESEDAARTEPLARLIEEAFGRAHVASNDDGEMFATLRGVLRFRQSARVVVTVIEERDVVVLRRLLEEEQRVVGGARCRVHMLRGDSSWGDWTPAPADDAPAQATA
ncbi:MAG: SulP family inorganic anion transporter [Myxococcota bacterium]